MKDGVSATLWMQRGDGKYDGVACLNGGSLLDLGAALDESFADEELAEKLIAGGVIDTVTRSGQVERGGLPGWTGLSESQMRVTAKSFTSGAYVYVFRPSRSEWAVGLGESERSLRALLAKIRFKRELLKRT